MTKIGSLKIKILHNLTESYIAGDKKQVKDILKTLKENKDFREVYLFYEEVENMFLEDNTLAKIYVENVERLLKEKSKKVNNYCKSLDKRFSKNTDNKVEVYGYLDVLTEDDTLKNIDKKIFARKKLVEHLTKKKKITEAAIKFTSNEHLLHFVLAERFNNDFEKMLTEEEKMRLGEIFSMSHKDLTTEFNSIKEGLNEKIEAMLTEQIDDTVKNKLEMVLKEAQQMPITKYNYYKLQQLKNGL